MSQTDPRHRQPDSIEQFRVCAGDTGERTPDCGDWHPAMADLAADLDSAYHADPPFDDVWIERRLLRTSEPERWEKTRV